MSAASLSAFAGAPRRPCWAFSGRLWWRLLDWQGWVCARCHPPGAWLTQVVWVEVIPMGESLGR